MADKAPIIADRFNRFAGIVARETILTGGEISLHCCGGTITEIVARYEANDQIGMPIVPPKGFTDKSGDLPAAWQNMLAHIAKARLGGTATLSVRSFLGKVYRIKVGFTQEWR